MIITRNNITPSIHSSAKIASSAQIIGNVTIGEHCYIDHNVVIESSGSLIEIEDNVIVLANSVIRSVGGKSRPPFPVHIQDHSLISPQCSLVGCKIGRNCYIATGVLIFQDTIIGDNCRISARAIVHVKTRLPANSRVPLCHIAVPTKDSYLITSDVQVAREWIGKANFFQTVFEENQSDQEKLQENVFAKLLEEVSDWQDNPA